MSTTKVYSVLDSGVSRFMTPFMAVNDAEAIRAFTTWVNDPQKQTNLSQFPEQFSLFCIGEFDDTNAIYGQEDKGHRQVILGVSVKDEAEKKFTLNELAVMLKPFLES